MHTRGDFTPETPDEARDRYEALEPVAKTVVREVASAMGFDQEEYGERVTDEVVARAQDALFSSSLAVQVGSREEFEDWIEAAGLTTSVEAEDDGDVVVLGSEHVENVTWHEPPAGAVVAATFQREEAAAVETLRRQVFGRRYRELIGISQ